MRRIGLINVAILVLVTVGLGFLAIALPNSGNFLVVDNRERSDAIVITQADSLDTAYWIGLRLLTTGYGRELLLDARSDRVYFGRTQAESAIDFIKKTAAGVSGSGESLPNYRRHHGARGVRSRQLHKQWFHPFGSALGG
jgi:hypothetical protein